MDEIAEAWEAIDAAKRHYRALVRRAVEAKEVTQVEISERLGRKRELIRQDAMTDEELAAYRAHEWQRQQAKRAGAAKTAPANSKES